MTYKEGISRFESMYRMLSLARKDRQIKFDQKEILMLLSDVQADLGNKYKLVTKVSHNNTVPSLNLVAGQSVYISGTGESHVPDDLFDIYLVTLNNDSKDVVRKKGQQDMSFKKYSGLPCYYTVRGTGSRVLEIDSIPAFSYADNNDYRLIIHYFQRLYTYSGVAENTFADLDFAEPDYGGSFVLPIEWNTAIIEGALVNFFPNRLELYQESVQSGLQARPVYFDSEMISYSGVYINNYPPQRDDTGIDPDR